MGTHNSSWRGADILASATGAPALPLGGKQVDRKAVVAEVAARANGTARSEGNASGGNASSTVITAGGANKQQLADKPLTEGDKITHGCRKVLRYKPALGPKSPINTASSKGGTEPFYVLGQFKATESVECG